MLYEVKELSIDAGLFEKQWSVQREGNNLTPVHGEIVVHNYRAPPQMRYENKVVVDYLGEYVPK